MAGRDQTFFRGYIRSRRVLLPRLKKPPDKGGTTRTLTRAFLVSDRRYGRRIDGKRQKWRCTVHVLNMTMDEGGQQYRKSRFEGACLDGGAARSVMGK